MCGTTTMGSQESLKDNNNDTNDHYNSKTSEEVLKLWQHAQAVCFNVDCTITKQDSLDHFATFLGKGDEVARISKDDAMLDGHLDLEESSLRQRLAVMEPTVDELKAYVQSNPAQDRLVPGIQQLIQELQARNVEIFLISSGFRELILPVADLLNVPRNNIYANRFVYKAENDDGNHGASISHDELDYYSYPTIRVTGMDPREPTSGKGGTPEAIRQIRGRHPYQTIVLIGDCHTDLEAAQDEAAGDGVDLFIGSGVVKVCDIVKEKADWYVTDYEQELVNALPRFKVAMVGSGSFASAAMQMVSRNARQKAIFESQIYMWVYEEEIEIDDGDGGKTKEKLTTVINQRHENPKYLPGVHYGDNVVAKPDLLDVVRGADLIIFALPHQYMHSTCKQIQLAVKPNAIAISLTKGMHIGPDGPQLMSAMVRRVLKLDCTVLMGANIAKEINQGGLCEATIASHNTTEHGSIFRDLFETPYFTVNVINDVEGAELAGALKNVVALAVGFAEGSDLGQNAKAAIMREGLLEMRRFSKDSFPTVQDETFLESCGVADLIATCYGGRNQRVAKEYARKDGAVSFDELEDRLLNGQKLQGVLTSQEVQVVLRKNGWEKRFPLFTAVHAIAAGNAKPNQISRYRELALTTSNNVSLRDEISFLEEKVGV